MIGEIVFEITRLWFHTMLYIWKNKYEGGHFIKKRSDGYQRWQQWCSDIKRRTMVKKTDDDRDNCLIKKSSSRRNYFTRRNTTK